MTPATDTRGSTMTNDTTTIQITMKQRERLEQLKQDGGYSSLKEVIAELLESGQITVSGIDEAKAREIAQDVVNQRVTHKALE